MRLFNHGWLSPLSPDSAVRDALRGPEWRLSGLRGEFLNAQSEAGYRQHTSGLALAQLRLALLIWGALLLAFALPDYAALGRTPAFWGCWACAYLWCSASLHSGVQCGASPSGQLPAG